ncbi:MAG TPA: MTH938/NDUFAF3 family protein [Gaiellales bacterium]|jgi:hypothetical protein|nr:MTH938/NDUFAF3 family protein [Gaiellales bacterium]
MTRVHSYRFGHVTVDGRQETRDVIVLPHRVVREWWRREGHGLVLADLEGVLDELPARLILGTGAYGQLHPDPETIRELERRGVAVEAMPTAEAVDRYGALDPAATAAALHLTC